jgi:hypothetical protein
MDRRTLLILIGVAALLAAIWLLTPKENSPIENALLFPGLKDDLNAIESVAITVGGNRRVVTLLRGSQQWAVEEKYGYSADVGKIRQNLIALGNAKIIERKTANPELYERLGLENLEDVGATGTLIEIAFTDDSGSEPLGLIVGKTGVRGNTAYVRRPGEEQGLMISADLDLGQEATDWLAPDLIDIASTDIKSITIIHPDGEIVRIEKSAQTDSEFSVLDVPDGRELLYSSIANPVAGLLSKLAMDDVLPADSIETSVSTPTFTRFETFDGLIVEAATYSIDDGVMVRFSATANDSMADRADELNSRLGSWVYSLPSFKSEQLGKRLSDFLKTDGE